MCFTDFEEGMKVKLLSRHGNSYAYENIEDWYRLQTHNKTVQKIKKQGYAVVIEFDDTFERVAVSSEIGGEELWFSPFDLTMYFDLKR